MDSKTRGAQSKLFIVVALLTAAVAIALFIGFIADSFFYSLEDLPQGQKVAELANPKGNLVVTVYDVQNPLGNAVRAEVYDSKTDKTKNFFWETDAQFMAAQWLDNRIININGHFIDVLDDSFDSRHPIIDDVPRDDASLNATATGVFEGL